MSSPACGAAVAAAHRSSTWGRARSLEARQSLRSVPGCLVPHQSSLRLRPVLCLCNTAVTGRSTWHPLPSAWPTGMADRHGRQAWVHKPCHPLIRTVTDRRALFRCDDTMPQDATVRLAGLCLGMSVDGGPGWAMSRHVSRRWARGSASRPLLFPGHGPALAFGLCRSDPSAPASNDKKKYSESLTNMSGRHRPDRRALRFAPCLHRRRSFLLRPPVSPLRRPFRSHKCRWHSR